MTSMACYLRAAVAARFVAYKDGADECTELEDSPEDRNKSLSRVPQDVVEIYTRRKER